VIHIDKPDGGPVDTPIGFPYTCKIKLSGEPHNSERGKPIVVMYKTTEEVHKWFITTISLAWFRFIGASRVVSEDLL
jgi:hypothetical protein